MSRETFFNPDLPGYNSDEQQPKVQQFETHPKKMDTVVEKEGPFKNPDLPGYNPNEEQIKVPSNSPIVKREPNRDQLVDTPEFKIKYPERYALYVEVIEREIEAIHEYGPKYIFLLETSAIPSGYALKEAWKIAYPDETVPIFYRIDPKTLFSMSNLSYRGQDKEDRETVEFFFKKRIKDNDAKILIYDEYFESGRSAAIVACVLVYPEISGFSPEIKCSNVAVTSYFSEGQFKRGDPRKKIKSINRYDSNRRSIFGSGSLRGLGKITEKTSSGPFIRPGGAEMDVRNEIGPDRGLRGRIIRRKDWKTFIHTCKSIGREAGQKLIGEREKDEAERKQ